MFLDPSLIVNQQLYGLISVVTKCIICEGILVNPMKCSNCDNTFCKNCIETWQIQSKSCPFQCAIPEYTPSKYLQRILSKLTFFCEKECLEIIAYNDYEKHLNFSCTNANLKETHQKALVKSKKLQIENEALFKLNSTLVDKIARLHLKSSKKDNEIISKTHLHPMVFGFRKYTWKCDNCKKEYSNLVKSSCCLKCDYDLCAQCYFYEFMSTS